MALPEETEGDRLRGWSAVGLGGDGLRRFLGGLAERLPLRERDILGADERRAGGLDGLRAPPDERRRGGGLRERECLAYGDLARLGGGDRERDMDRPPRRGEGRR